MLSKFLNLFKVLLYPLLFIIGQFLIMLVFMIVFMVRYPTLSLNSNDFNLMLYNYLSDKTLLILLIECMLFIPLFYFNYKKIKMNKKEYKLINILSIIGISFILSIFLNFLILLLKKMIGVDISTSQISLMLILSTGIIGPILEELLFRGIVYGKLLNFFSTKASLWLSAVVFAVFHTGGIFQILFAFFVGMYFTFIYEKYHDIKLSMLSHIVVNVTSILMGPLLLSLL